MRRWLLLLVTLLLLVLAFTVAAQSGYDLSWWNIGGGGGTSALGDYTLGGTVGQADAGPTMSGDNYDLAGGFQAFGLQPVSAGEQTIYLPMISSQ